jgi:hypothetical protein
MASSRSGEAAWLRFVTGGAASCIAECATLPMDIAKVCIKSTPIVLLLTQRPDFCCTSSCPTAPDLKPSQSLRHSLSLAPCLYNRCACRCRVPHRPACHDTAACSTVYVALFASRAPQRCTKASSRRCCGRRRIHRCGWDFTSRSVTCSPRKAPPARICRSAGAHWQAAPQGRSGLLLQTRRSSSRSGSFLQQSLSSAQRDA